MGVCQSTNDKSTKRIDAELKKDKLRHDQLQKLLILGTGESGKSTVLKQMRILHCEGFTTEERIARKGIICNNIIGQLCTILTAMKDLDISLDNADLQPVAHEMIAKYERDREMESLTEEDVSNIQTLWSDVGVQRCYDRRSEYQLNDSTKYFIESVERVAAVDYVPTVQDMLMSRVCTTGAVQIMFTFKNLQFRVFDVGGQRSERKKWIHCFDDVNAILYVAAINEYDQKLREDNSTNRLHESIKLFEMICNLKFFVDCSFILFLNKTDLFREKIEQQKVPLSICFPEYKGELSYAAMVEYIGNQFRCLLSEEGRDKTNQRMYVHETCATDCNQVQHVVKSVCHRIVSDTLKETGAV